MWRLSPELERAVQEAQASLSLEQPSLYVHELAIARRQLAALRRAMPDEVDIYYAMKANPHPHALRFLAAQPELSGIEVASAGELSAALEVLPAHRIAFSGPGKTGYELGRAVSARVGHVHLESLVEAHRLSGLAAAGPPQDVLVRVNPARHASALFNACAAATSKFGVDEDQLRGVLEAVSRLPGLRLRGIHAHVGSGFDSAGAYLAYADHVLDLARRLRDEGFPMARIDLGGGFSLDYALRGDELDIGAIGAGLSALRRAHGLGEARLVIEPGRYIMGPAGVYATPIVDIKRSGGRAVIVTAGGINHQRRPQSYGENHPTAIVPRAEPPLFPGQPAVARERVALIGGPLCTARDWLARELDVERAEIGDLVVLGLSGAYGASASPAGFLGHPPPAQRFVLEGRPYPDAALAAPALAAQGAPAPAWERLEEFLEQRVAPVADRLDADVALMRALVSEAAAGRLLDHQLARELGAAGDRRFGFRYFRRVAACSGALAFVLKQNGTAFRLLSEHGGGSAEIRRMLGRLAEGELTVGLGLSCGHETLEPLRAAREGDSVVLRGSLALVSGYGVFDALLVDFMLDARAHLAPVPFVAGEGASGALSVRGPMPLLGLASTATVSARFADLRVDPSVVMGPYDAVAATASPAGVVTHCLILLGCCEGLLRLLRGASPSLDAPAERAAMIEHTDRLDRELGARAAALEEGVSGASFGWAMRRRVETVAFAQRCLDFGQGALGARTAVVDHPLHRFRGEIAVLSLASNHPAGRGYYFEHLRERALA